MKSRILDRRSKFIALALAGCSPAATQHPDTVAVAPRDPTKVPPGPSASVADPDAGPPGPSASVDVAPRLLASLRAGDEAWTLRWEGHWDGDRTLACIERPKSRAWVLCTQEAHGVDSVRHG